MHKFDIRVFELDFISGTNPGAGNELTFDPSDALRIEILSISFLYTADANVANRYPTLQLTNGTQTVTVGHQSGAITANEAITCNFSNKMPYHDHSAVSQILFAPLPDNLFIQGGESIVTNTLNLQVGDAMTDIFIRYKSWFAA